MEVVHRESGSVYLRGYGDHAASTLTLTEAARPGIGRTYWRASSPEAASRRATAIAAAGRGIGWSVGDFCRGPSYHFRDPDGHPMAVYFEEQKYRAPPQLRSTLKNLPMKYVGRGVNVRRLDHLAVLCRDVPLNRQFRTRPARLSAARASAVRPRQESDRRLAQPLDPAPSAGLCGRRQRRKRPPPSYLALGRQPRGRAPRRGHTERERHLHRGRAGLPQQLARLLSLRLRTGGNRVEIYSGSYLVFAPDWEPVTWNEEERGTGVYWGGALPQSFLDYATADAEAPAERVPVFDLQWARSWAQVPTPRSAAAPGGGPGGNPCGRGSSTNRNGSNRPRCALARRGAPAGWS